MKKSSICLSIGLSCLTMQILGCSGSSPKPEQAVVRDANVTVSMHALKNEMDLLLPYMADPKQFYSGENQKKIQSEIEKLEQISANVQHAPAMKNQDPTLTSLSRGFQEEIRRSREAFQQGKKEYARGSLLNVTAYCIECHTRTSSGPQFQTSAVESTLKTLSPLDRGEYLMATRQFDGALKEFQSVIRSGSQQKLNVFDLDKAARLSLVITVRFLSKPDQALEVVEEVIKSPHSPYYLKTTAQAWKQSLQDWKKEPKKILKKDALVTCQELIQKGQAKVQGRDDRAGDIEMLRAQALLHPILVTEKNQNRLGQALYLTGIAYESFRDQAMWSLHEDYYESCIRTVPHSDWSAKCYRQLEESIMMGYTGSSGTSLPTDVEKKLNELQKLAL